MARISLYICIYIYIYIYIFTDKQLLRKDSRLLSFQKAHHNTTSERGFCFVSGRIPQTHAIMTLIDKLDGNWNSLPRGQPIFLQLWARVYDLGASVCREMETESACDWGVVVWLLVVCKSCEDQYVTPKGVPLPAMCKAGATRAGL